MAIETGTPTRKTVCVTIGVVKDFSPGKSWWYKSCNVCPLAMREEGDGYKYSRCKAESQNFTPRYSLNLKVGDEESYASFIVYETIGSECLNISAAELRTKYIMRGGNRIDFPEELSKFKNKMFLFKVSVKLENINSFQLVSITVVKLCHNEAIINSFKQKYSIEQDAFFSINSNLITLPADYSDKNKNADSQVGEYQPDIESSKFITPITSGQNSSSAGKNITVNEADDGGATFTWDKHTLVANPAHFFTEKPTATFGVASDAAESERFTV
ncbi:uncharacterized protein DS421_20g701720 [Arachis hypogaea]|nr:uncharacterized protein DS421_20g701720 [Arachis hypogaea]